MPDIYQSIDAQAAETVKAVVDRLEARAGMDAFIAMRERYFDRIDWTGARRILDLGCGTGASTRAIAARAQPGAEVVGSDLSAELIAEAKALTPEAPAGAPIRYEVADSGATGDTAGQYDLVFAHTLVSHASDPAAVLSEAARVLRPGGVIAVFDGDYASITFGHGDADENAAMVKAMLKAVVANPHVLRQFPALVRAAGLAISDFIPDLLAEAGHNQFFAFIDAYIPAAIGQGHLDEATGQDWLARQHAASEDGAFFGACNYYTYLLRKPG